MFRFQFPTFLTASDIFYVLHVTANVAVTENKSSLVFILAPTIASVVVVCNKLIAIKQQGVPKRRSLLKPPAGPRYWLWQI